MKTLLLTTALYLCFFSTLMAQPADSPFNEVDEAELIVSQQISDRIITPNSYSTLLLDMDKLDLILKSAPDEEDIGTSQSEPLEVILPNGKTETFYLVEYSMMEPALAAQYPTTKTYYGYGTTDRRQRIRLDWTSNGLNAMMQLPEGLAFIKPYSRGDTEHYLSYYERDLPANTEPFLCGTVDEKPVDPIEMEDASRAGDCQLRTYRLAVAVTGEYATSTLGASSAGTAADDAIVTDHIVTHINQINEWYERDLTARFILIANLSDVFYYNGATDPYTNSNSIAMLAENDSNLDAVIGSANYDLGHVLGNSGGSSGVASLNVLCSGDKGRGVTRASASGITQPRFLKVWSHEMGHQFGAGHTQGEQCQRASASAMEPGAGTTLMSYVTSSCDNQIQNFPEYYFHAISIQQMSARMLSTSCADILPSDNTAPTVSAGPDVTVPSSTPLLLEAVASDDEGDPLTYTWEQFNNELAEEIPPEPTNTQGPNFRSLFPSDESGRYLPNLEAVIDGVTPTWEVLPSVARTMDFRVTVRDNSMNSMSCTAEDDIEITTVAEGPFQLISPTTAGVIWIEEEIHNVSWDVAGTNVAPVSCANVDILLSYDGGFTYPVTLASNVTNNGTADVMVPAGVTTTARVQVRCSDNIFYNISAENFEIQISTGPTFIINIPNPLATVCPGDVASNITLTSSALAGFSDNISLSTTNLPGAATVTFASQVIAPGTGTTFEIGNTGGLAEGSYTFSVVGTSGAIVRDLSFELTVLEAAGTTTLDQPADGAAGVSLNPTLSWQPKSNATSYDVQLSDDAAFANLIVDENQTANAYSVAMSLEGLTTYYWRVKATTSCGETPWSLVREFTTGECVSFTEDDPVPISASGTPEVSSVLTATGPGTVEEITVSNVLGTHSWVGDLTVELIGPGGGPTVILWDNLCGSNDDFDLSFNDNAADPVSAAGCNPLGQGGTFRPVGSLSSFNGLSIAGDWTLNITDNVNQDGGELSSWSLEFCSAGPLPVELLSFEATAGENSIQLDWKTADEINNKGFDIERRTENERNFTRIGEVLAADEAQPVNDYKYLDTDVRPGVRYYYRLRQNDYDGQHEYSPIRTASIEGDHLGLQVYPTPVRGTLFGSLAVGAGVETELRLFDLNGRVVKEQVVMGEAFEMDLWGLPAGVYVLKGRYAGGEEIVKLVVE